MTYDNNNIFAKIIRGEISSDKVFEDERVLAFNDISRAAPIHVLVIPKGSYLNLCDFVNKASSYDVKYFFQKVDEIASKLKAKDPGFRIISNVGSDAHQSVEHFHVHILAGKKLGPLLSSDNLLR